MLDLSIITVTYQSEKQIDSLLRSVKDACQKISYEHIIVDNGSSDGTVTEILAAGQPTVCLPQGMNLGFSAANLIGYRHSKGKYVLFLNPDMELEASGLDRLLEWMKERSEVGIAGCRLLDQKGKFNSEAAPRRFPKLYEQFILLLKLQTFFPKALNRYFYKDLDFTKEQEVDSVRGSFMLMRREFIEAVGWPFDPLYYIWFEDVDICREAWKRGFRVVYSPLTVCRDAIGQSFKQRERRWRFRQYAESLYRYLKKWEPFYIWWWVPLLYRPLALLVGSRWMEKMRERL
jgi:GT2 family glycosyltransferase